MLRLIGLMFLVLCGGMLGMLAAARLRRELRYREQIHQLLVEYGIAMRWNGDTTAMLTMQLAAAQAFSELQFLQQAAAQIQQGSRFFEAWSHGVQSDRMLSDAVRSLLLELGETLGTSDLEGQLLTLEQYQLRLEPMITDARQRYQKTGRLYRSLGLLGGMMAALLLC